MISKDKTYRTRDGREVRIYATDGGWSCPVHGAVKEMDGWSPSHWFSDGHVLQDKEHRDDLIEVKPRINRTVWLDVYPNGIMCSEKKQENYQRFPGLVACVKVEIDCEEGEGL
jgi:hypothetical protein